MNLPSSFLCETESFDFLDLVCPCCFTSAVNVIFVLRKFWPICIPYDARDGVVVDPPCPLEELLVREYQDWKIDGWQCEDIFLVGVDMKTNQFLAEEY